MRVLLVEDDDSIAVPLVQGLARFGIVAEHVTTGAAALAAPPADLVLLDLGLPDIDGVDVCWELNRTRNVPIIMLTSRRAEADLVRGLEGGADDYLAKPFSPRELLARIKVILRRTRSLPPNLQPQDDPLLHFAGWTLDTSRRELLSAAGDATAISGVEYKLLRVFLAHPNRVLSREQLLDLTQGREADPLDRSIDVQVSRLRQRLGDDPRSPALIKTVRGEGYVLSVPVDKVS